MSGDVPRFGNAAMMKNLFGLSSPQLRQMVVQGFVRTIKFKNSKQGARLYLTADVENALGRLAIGRKPKTTAPTLSEGGAS